MSTFRTPGQQSPSVYRRRRVVVGLGVLAVIVVILLLVFGHKGGSTPAATSPGQSHSATPKPTARTTSAAAAGAACQAANLTVTAKADKTSYAKGVKPKLSFTITNNGSTDCTVTAGSDVQEYAITSGSETYWDSKDCQTNPQPAKTVIKAGEDVSSGGITWDRTRSSKSTCDATRAQVPAGGASYHVTVTVNGVTSKSSPQFILL